MRKIFIFFTNPEAESDPDSIHQTKSVVFRHLGKILPFWKNQTGRGEENTSEFFWQSGCSA
jgi:hypothetical protein